MSFQPRDSYRLCSSSFAGASGFVLLRLPALQLVWPASFPPCCLQQYSYQGALEEVPSLKHALVDENKQSEMVSSLLIG